MYPKVCDVGISTLIVTGRKPPKALVADQEASDLLELVAAFVLAMPELNKGSTG